MLRAGGKGLLIAQEQGAGELQVLLASFLRCRAHTRSLTAPFSGRCSSSILGLLAAEGPFAKVRLPEPVEEGEFCFRLCFSVMMLRSRPVSDLPYTFSSSQQQGKQQDGGSPAAARYGCSRLRKVSVLLLSCSFLTIFRIRPAHALFPSRRRSSTVCLGSRFSSVQR